MGLPVLDDWCLLVIQSHPPASHVTAHHQHVTDIHARFHHQFSQWCEQNSTAIASTIRAQLVNSWSRQGTPGNAIDNGFDDIDFAYAVNCSCAAVTVSVATIVASLLQPLSSIYLRPILQQLPVQQVEPRFHSQALFKRTDHPLRAHNSSPDLGGHTYG